MEVYTMINELDIVDYLDMDENNESKLKLIITDHLEWSWRYQEQHLWLLQEKLNNYINYILNEDYKKLYKNKIQSFEILIYEKYKPRKKFEKLLDFFNESIKQQCPKIKIEITYQVSQIEDENIGN